MFEATTLDEFLTEYGPALGRATQDVMAPLHTPGKDPIDWIPTFARKPFEAQAHVIAAGVKLLNRQKGLIVVGEMGTGKTLMGQAIAHAHASRRRPGRSARRTMARTGDCRLGEAVAPRYRALVQCPPQLCAKWGREIKDTIPGARVYQLEAWSDVYHLDASVPPSGPEWYVIGRETAKLSSSWRPGVRRRGLEFDDGKLVPRLKRRKWRAGPWVEQYRLRYEELYGWVLGERYAAGVYCPKCGQVQVDEDGLYIDRKSVV